MSPITHMVWSHYITQNRVVNGMMNFTWCEGGVQTTKSDLPDMVHNYHLTPEECIS